MESFAVIRQGYDDAHRVQKILNLPDEAWSDIKVKFGLDEVATAEVTFLLTGDQLQALASIAWKRNTAFDCVDPTAELKEFERNMGMRKEEQ